MGLVENEKSFIVSYNLLVNVLGIGHVSQVCGLCGTSSQMGKKGSKRMKFKISNFYCVSAVVWALQFDV